MNPRSMTRRSRALLAAAMFFAPCGTNMAALTDLADLPMAYLIANNATAIKHNLMFMLDDSGSMQQDYTPDYVNDKMCYDYKDDDGVIRNVTSGTTTALKPCLVGDPLFMSPDFNTQYYNPAIYYTPPKKADGTSYPNANPAAAKPDPFGVQNTGILQETPAGGTVDLRTNWPDREWCSSANGGTCVRNNSGYDYPNDVYGYGRNKQDAYGNPICTSYDTFYGSASSGNKCINYVPVVPYYWRIEPSEYCTDDELTTCSSTSTTTATTPSTLRWCTDYTLANCQARQLSGYAYPRNVGKWNSGTAQQSATAAVYVIDFATVNNDTYGSSSTAYIKLVADNGTVYNFFTATSSNKFNVVISRSGQGAANARKTDLATYTQGKMNNAGGLFTISRNAGVITITANNAGSAYNGRLSVSLPKVSTADGPNPTSGFSCNVASGSSACAKIGKTVGTDAVSFVAGSRSQQYRMTRYNIDSNEAWRDKSNFPARIDCVANAQKCTYAEEMQNFANWYSYYRTRLQSMKSSAALAFSSLDDKLRIGFNTINQPSISSVSTKYLPLAPFDTTQKNSWYSKLFATTVSSGGTPLRSALKRMGDLYSTRGAYDTADDRAQCQRNFTLLTTDGYWNGDSGFSFGNFDNSATDALADRQRTGRYDGGSATNASNTLSDIAYYYYKNDLVANNILPNSVKPNADNITWQNMTTYTLGLGVSGLMRYTPSYENTGDFQKIKNGVAGACSWSSTCDWPVPAADSATAVDDLWHAAVNGGGKYFSAKDPATLVSGLKNIISSINTDTGSGGAAATSSPNITQSDNWLFSSTYTPDSDHNDWSGQVEGRQLDALTGQLPVVPTNGDWTAQSQLQPRVVTGNSNPRVIYTFSATGTPRVFNAASLVPEIGYFTNKGSALDQYASLSIVDKGTLDSAANMIAFIAGDQANVGTVFRDRQKVLGDIVHSRPAYIKAPPYGYTDTGYSNYVQSNANRQGVVYVGANDGMLHAFAGLTGAEKWAYIPKLLMPELYRLAEKNYLSKHRFFVDGEPQISDVKFGSDWKTILVIGMGKGGKGYAALDITDPDNPRTLWEFCQSASLCGTHSDPNLGYSFGNPIITKWKPLGSTTEKWVVIVTSGHNNSDGSSNTTNGDGKGWLYILDAQTGNILSKTSTGSGSPTNPSGLSRINSWVDNPYADNTSKYVYGGDLNGDLWRFDLTAAENTTGDHPVPVVQLGTLMNATGTGQRQPVTTKPELIECSGYPMVLLGTGRLLGSNDIGNTEIQSLYGIVDRGVSYGTSSLRTYGLVQQTATVYINTNDNNDPNNGNFNVSNNAVNPAPGHDNGWYMDLAAGQRVNVDPALGLGTLVIAGNKPTAATACSFKGVGVTYQLAACSGGLVASGTAMVGKLDSDAMVAGLTLFQLSDGRLFVNRSRTDGRQIQEQVLTNASTAGGRRVSWRELVQ